MLNHDDTGRNDAWLVSETAAAMRDLAGTVTEAPPLRRPDTATAHCAHEPRRWIRWTAPLAAAAAIVVVAVSLGLAKGSPDGGKAGNVRHTAPTAAPAASAVPVESGGPAIAAGPVATAGPSGTPRYYVAIKQLNDHIDSSGQRTDIVVGDTVTGQALVTFTPPPGVVFQTVTGDADDRTFVVFATESSTVRGAVPIKGVVPAADTVATGSWYMVRLAPGEAASLTRLPIKPVTVNGSAKYGPALDQLFSSFSSAVSGSGAELAVPEKSPRSFTVKVFSVISGQLLHAWTTSDSSAVADSSLTWIDGDRKLAMFRRTQTWAAKSVADDRTTDTVAVLPASGPASGDLLADSTIVWSLTTDGLNPAQVTTLESCAGPGEGGPPAISADGKTFTCVTQAAGFPVEHASFLTYPLAAGTTASVQATSAYEMTATGLHSPAVLWTSPSGGTAIGALVPYANTAAAPVASMKIGAISHGTFTPLRFPASLTAPLQPGTPFLIAF
jgi:hypothetical protein